MVKPSSHIPFYKQIIGLLRNAFVLLDEQGREEVLQFVISQQNPEGGFQDRGGRSDLYYSLFGWMMLKAAEEKGSTEKGERKTENNVPHNDPAEGNPQHLFRQYISTLSTPEVPGFIERCCLVLLQKDLKIRWYLRMKSIWSLGRSFWRERHSINLSYRSFVLFLTLDAVFPFTGILKRVTKRILVRTDIDQNSPCSEVAAIVFLLRMLNHQGTEEQDLLKSFACETGGFKTFLQNENADMLSTAVALFALNFAGSDLRLLKPACLDFIQRNYAYGAFLSGDGDQTKDLEYTFYGLLALGVLAN